MKLNFKSVSFQPLALSSLLAFTVFSTPILNAHRSSNEVHPDLVKPVLADLNTLIEAKIPIMYKDEEAGLGYALLTPEAERKLSEISHAKGRCGNFEALSEVPQNLNLIRAQMNEVKFLKAHQQRNASSFPQRLEHKVQIQQALDQVNTQNIFETVKFLSSFKTRFNKGAQANDHILPFMERIKLLTQNSKLETTLETISHTSTPQKSIKLTIKGAQQAEEILVFGAHLDSINGWGSTSTPAPGADDNASGSASLLEAAQVILNQDITPARTLEFYWYAGEESGLLGSAEIAEQAKKTNKNIISVLQLDMTLFPGDGENAIASMSDFTHPWLRNFLLSANDTYLKINIQSDQCGYGCSDHASWYRRGFPTLFPTESKFKSSFKSIHTERDIISPLLNFNHAAQFTKIALILALELGNSDQRPL